MTLGNSPPPRPHRPLGRKWRWRAGFVSIHFVNVISHARVAPYGGRRPRASAPIRVCIGVPLPGEPPFLLDYATSAVAQGKLRVAHNKGVKVPPGRLIDDVGEATDDPRYAVCAALTARC